MGLTELPMTSGALSWVLWAGPTSFTTGTGTLAKRVGQGGIWENLTRVLQNNKHTLTLPLSFYECSSCYGK